LLSIVIKRRESKIFSMANKKPRKVKLYSKSRPCQSSCRGLKEVPWLKVSGLWLAQAGFCTGNQVEITVRENELSIINPYSYE